MKPSLAIVIPVGPGETAWRELLPQLDAAGALEIALVLPVGELEDPYDLSSNVTVVRASTGRAAQLNAGAAASGADWLWFVHADCRVDARTLAAATGFITADAAAIGYFDLRFLDDGPRLTALNTLGANLRSRWLGLPFGDQGLLMSRRVFQALGGFDQRLPGGEDHALAWTARKAGIPLRRLAAPIYTSARKYAQRGWWHTTLRHLLLTWQQAWQFSRPRGTPMTCGVGIFVKTPNLSPVKTRLWPALGRRCAESLYLISAEAVASVAEEARRRVGLTPYWAVAEASALDGDAWLDLPHVRQGTGCLGERMGHVYRTLRQRHRGAILIGADAPQIVPEALERAAEWLASIESRLVIGRALDGGFWLFGGNIDLPERAWTSPQYSSADTAAQFVRAMRGAGRWLELETLADIDTAADLPGAHAHLSGLAAPTVAQVRVRDWLGQLTAMQEPEL